MSDAVRLAHAILGPPVCPVCKEELKKFVFMTDMGFIDFAWNGVQYTQGDWIEKYKSSPIFDEDIFKWGNDQRSRFTADFYHLDLSCQFYSPELRELIKDMIPVRLL